MVYKSDEVKEKQGINVIAVCYLSRKPQRKYIGCHHFQLIIMTIHAWLTGIAVTHPTSEQLWNLSLKKNKAWTGFQPMTSEITLAVLHQQSHQANGKLVTLQVRLCTRIWSSYKWKYDNILKIRFALCNSSNYRCLLIKTAKKESYLLSILGSMYLSLYQNLICTTLRGSCIYMLQ